MKALEFLSPSTIRLWQDGGPAAEDFIVFQFGISKGYASSSPPGYGCFNQELGSTLPPSLERLWLSSTYDQPLDGVACPNGVATLGLPFHSWSYNFSRITLPSSVKTLFSVDKVNRAIRLPEGAEVKILEPYGERSNWDDDIFSDDW